MTRAFVFLPMIAAAAALAATPALAKTKKHHRAPHAAYVEPYVPYPGAGWTSRNVSDPSFGNRAGINTARSYGRCVEDLGYGRWEYCGW